MYNVVLLYLSSVYMAPEVVREQEMGRALDIWSVGCVVVEMITGKVSLSSSSISLMLLPFLSPCPHQYPWIDHDNQFTILYLLGKGKHPPYPDDVEDEANEFLQQCFIPEPSERPSASELLGHTFVKVSTLYLLFSLVTRRALYSFALCVNNCCPRVTCYYRHCL